jgi:hypothetical protein
MDWIKVLVKHLIYEYRDLSDHEYAAWIKLMAITAHLEHIPDRKQMLAVANYQTIDSLERKLHNHSTDLSSILHKVLIDVSYVAHRRELSKINTQRFRERTKDVSDNVIITSSHREEKSREENKKNKPYTEEFEIFYTAYPNRKDKSEAYRAWCKRNGSRPPIDVLLSAIENQKLWRESAKPGEFRPEWKNPATWLNKGSWEDEVDVTAATDDLWEMK